MKQADIIIIGGGLAGLVAAIHLATYNFNILLFEKEKFPRHKVCGEYLSNEILPYFKYLNLDISKLQPKPINKLLFSNHSGKTTKIPLDLGGLGISRYSLDHFLYQKASANGVEVIHEQITQVNYNKNSFEVKDSKNTSYVAKVVLGAFGKRSVLDKTLNRNFIHKKSSWLAVKAHYKSEKFPHDTVALHNFKGGYCGLSRTENNHVNLCYLTNYKSFKTHKKPKIFQENVLNENKNLKEFFSEATPVFNKELSIAQISFNPKKNVVNHMLMLGDSAGLIHPLCGNGMAMAIHSAKIASEVVRDFLSQKNLSRDEMEKQYIQQWNTAFKKRLKYGRWLQHVFLKESLVNTTQAVVTAAPFLLSKIIKKTHGRPII